MVLALLCAALPYEHMLHLISKLFISLRSSGNIPALCVCIKAIPYTFHCMDGYGYASVVYIDKMKFQQLHLRFALLKSVGIHNFHNFHFICFDCFVTIYTNVGSVYTRAAHHRINFVRMSCVSEWVNGMAYFVCLRNFRKSISMLYNSLRKQRHPNTQFAFAYMTIHKLHVCTQHDTENKSAQINCGGISI